MTAGRVICEDCDGRRYRGGAKCASCDGHGTVETTGAHDALIEILAPVCDPGTARAVLERLDTHRAETAAWLVETGILLSTVYALRPVPPSGPLVNPWSKDYVRPGTNQLVDFTEMGPHGRRLWTVDAPA